MSKPEWAVMPMTDYENAMAAVKEQLGDDTPILSGELAEKIKAITPRPIKVRNCDYLFQNNRRFEQIDGFDLSEVTGAAYMFDGATQLQNLPESLNVANSATGANFMKGCAAVVNLPDMDFSNADSLASAWHGCTSLHTSGKVKIGAKCKNLASAWQDCKKLTAMPISEDSDLSGVTTILGMFHNCEPMSGEFIMDASNLTNAGYAFYACTKLTKIVLNNSSKVANFNFAFFACARLQWLEIDLSGVDKSSVGFGTQQAFQNCGSLSKLVLHGTLYYSVGFTNCPLDAESAISIINALEDYSGTDNEGTYSITFSSATKTALNALGAVSPNGNTWLEYANDKGWNT